MSPLEKKDAPTSAPKKAKAKAADPQLVSPSAHALSVVGELPEDVEEGSPEAAAHGEKYQAEKRKMRFGY